MNESLWVVKDRHNMIWVVTDCYDLSAGTITYKITHESYPGEEYHFSTEWGATTAARIFNRDVNPDYTKSLLGSDNILFYKNWEDQRFVKLNQNIVQAALTRVLLGDKVAGYKLVSHGSIQLDKILLKIADIRGKINQFFHVLVYGTGNPND